MDEEILREDIKRKTGSWDFVKYVLLGIRDTSMKVDWLKEENMSALLYDSEAWRLNSLRCVWSGKEWFEKQNEEREGTEKVYELFGMTEMVKRSALRWYWHVRRKPVRNLKRVYVSEYCINGDPWKKGDHPCNGRNNLSKLRKRGGGGRFLGETNL